MFGTVNNKPLFASIAAALSASVNPGWTVEPANFGGDDDMQDRGYIVNGTVRLFARPVWNKAGRLEISASLLPSLADYKPYNASLPSITLDGSKPAAVIAKDITRRILPGTMEIIEAAQRSQAAQDKRDNTKRSGLDTLNAAAGALGTVRAKNSYGSKTEQVLDLRREKSGGFYGTAEVTPWTGVDGTNSATVEMELHSLTVAQAAALLEALRGIMNASPVKDVEVKFSYQIAGEVFENAFKFRPRMANEIATAYGDAVREQVRDVMGMMEPAWTSARVSLPDGSSFTVTN